MLQRPAALALVLASAVASLAATSCGDKAPDKAANTGSSSAAPASTAGSAPTGSPAAASPPGTTAAATGAPAGNPPPDGKYERVQVEGVTVPMINVMNGGTVILVDTDGKKPRTWEEQYKRKRAELLAGQYDIHKTDVNHDDDFEKEAIDKEGLWVIDAKGNLTKH